MTRAGRFITFEGGEGSGKSTHAHLLAERLRAIGLKVITTREPGGTPEGEAIRELLLHGEPERWDAVGEALLHFAARRVHLTRLIWPALDAGDWVIGDRFADSTLAYQGYALGLGREPVERLYALAVGDFAPDLTLIMDLPVERGLQRARGRGQAEDRYQQRDVVFHQRIRDGFADIALRAPERCVVIDADRPPAAVVEAVNAAVFDRLGVVV